MVFITGASGNTGRALLGRIAEDPELRKIGVTCLVRPGGRRDILERYPVRVVEGDASDAGSLGRAYGGEPIVIHISSILHAAAVCAACRGAERLIAISSTGLFSRYRSLAGAIAEGERTVERSGMSWTILRPTMIYGTPSDRNVSRLIRLINRSPVIPLPSAGGSIFQPVHVEDLASSILAALKEQPSIGRSYNLPGGSAHPLAEIISIIAGLLGKRVAVIPVPFALADLTAGLYERLSPRPRLRREQIRRLREDKSFDFSDAARDLGYAPMPFREGVARQIALMGLARG